MFKSTPSLNKNLDVGFGLIGHLMTSAELLECDVTGSDVIDDDIEEEDGDDDDEEGIRVADSTV